MSIIMFLKKRHKEHLSKKLNKFKSNLANYISLMDSTKKLYENECNYANYYFSYFTDTKIFTFLILYYRYLDRSVNSQRVYDYYEAKSQHIKNKIANLEAKLK